MEKRVPGTKNRSAKENVSGASRSKRTRRSFSETEAPTPSPAVENNISIYTPPYDFRNCKTRVDHDGPYFLPDVVAAIRATDGNFLEMSALLGRRRSSVRDYVYATLDAKDVWDEVRECYLDSVEQVARDITLNDRDPATVRFTLSTLGKDRGYAPTVQHSTSDNRPLSFELVLSEGSEKVVEALNQKKAQDKKVDEMMEQGVMSPFIKEK